MSGSQNVPAALEAQLTRFAREQFGPDAAPAAIRPMLGGHAGLTFGFEIRRNGEPLADLILKLAPPGVRREGNTDVYRQAPLLHYLLGFDLPVPDVPFAASDEALFGVPYVMMERLDGREFFIWDPHPDFSRDPDAIRPLWSQMAEALAAFHAPQVSAGLADWEAPRPLVEEIGRWERVYRKAPDPAWAEAADRIRRRLLETMPQDAPLGLVHGDFQPGNGLFHAGKLSGVIDWELASHGAQFADVGWLMMCADETSWVPAARPVNPPDPDVLLAVYEDALGRRVPDIDWYRALAGYRLGSITCLNVYLHRSGKRVDAVWERFAENAPTFFARAGALLGA